MWFVEFYCEFNDICLSTKPLWADFSNKFTTTNLQFGEINLDKMKELAKIF
jgi:hypothetical protein